MANTQTWKAEDFPCTLQLNIPFPSAHYASTALRALAVDAELSPLVRRSFSLASESTAGSSEHERSEHNLTAGSSERDKREPNKEQNILAVHYAATTNRMLRVAVNGFFESVGVVIGVMKDLDVDVLHEPVTESLSGVQGLVVAGVEGRG